MDTTQLSAAAERFQAALGAAAGEPGLDGRALDAYRAYATRLADAAAAPAAAEATRAFEAYRDVIAGGFRAPGAADRLRDAYRRYLADVQAAWAGGDATALAPTDLAAVGQGLAYVGWLVDTALGAEPPARAEPEQTAPDAIEGERRSSLWGSSALLTDHGRR